MNTRNVVIGLIGLGVLAAFGLVKSSPRRKIAILAAWLVPGAGHVVMGQWKKGLFFLWILGLTWLFGMWIVGFRQVSFDDNPFYYVGQFGSGATWILASGISSEKAVLRPDVHPSWFDPGLLYVCVVGLLNLVLVLNIFDLKRPTPVVIADPPAEKPA
jgi:hypothetical protein